MPRTRPLLAAAATVVTIVPALGACTVRRRRRPVHHGLQRPARGAARRDRARRSPRRPASRSSCATATTSSSPTSSSRRAAASPADVFLTENSPAMSLVDSKGLFAPLDAKTLAQVPAQYDAATTATGWVSPPARPSWSTTPTRSSEAELPASIMDLAEPEWKGRIVVLAHRRRLPGDRQRGPRSSRARRPPRTWLDGLKATARSTRATTRA